MNDPFCGWFLFIIEFDYGQHIKVSENWLYNIKCVYSNIYTICVGKVWVYIFLSLVKYKTLYYRLGCGNFGQVNSKRVNIWVKGNNIRVLCTPYSRHVIGGWFFEIFETLTNKNNIKSNTKTYSYLILIKKKFA